ncbi:hypothetical protein J2D73_11810 [Acetobacter sacchari]|uniref:Transposase n=1 Tax=Acetobacter sacchari TaxID=2661687 RepID=A0ABS3LX44_9PROT|nr:hypothetical protein [Acetobacter sacchari]MBO1360474.1 hypothetical protein [Acetobacter sacchari]
MSDLFLLSERQMDLIKPYFPLAHGLSRVDDRRVLNGIGYMVPDDFQQRRPERMRLTQDFMQRLFLWSFPGVFDRIFTALTEQADR